MRTVRYYFSQRRDLFALRSLKPKLAGSEEHHT